EQRAFRLAAEDVPADRTVGANHAVTRDQQRNRVAAERVADGARRLGRSDLACAPAVGARAPARDLGRLAQYALLERRALAQVDGHGAVLAAQACARGR